MNKKFLLLCSLVLSMSLRAMEKEAGKQLVHGSMIDDIASRATGAVMEHLNIFFHSLPEDIDSDPEKKVMNQSMAGILLDLSLNQEDTNARTIARKMSLDDFMKNIHAMFRQHGEEIGRTVVHGAITSLFTDDKYDKLRFITMGVVLEAYQLHLKELQRKNAQDVEKEKDGDVIAALAGLSSLSSDDDWGSNGHNQSSHRELGKNKRKKDAGDKTWNPRKKHKVWDEHGDESLVSKRRRTEHKSKNLQRQHGNDGRFVKSKESQKKDTVDIEQVVRNFKEKYDLSGTKDHCPLPECKSKASYKTLINISRHFGKAHKEIAEEIRNAGCKKISDFLKILHRLTEMEIMEELNVPNETQAINQLMADETQTNNG